MVAANTPDSLNLPLTGAKQLSKQALQLGREFPLASKHVIMTKPPCKNLMVIIIIYKSIPQVGMERQHFLTPGTGLVEDMGPLGPNSAPGLKNRGRDIMTSISCECV